MKIRLKHNLIKVHFNPRYRPDCLWLGITPAHCQTRLVCIEEEGQTINQGFLHMYVCWKTRMKCISDPIPSRSLFQSRVNLMNTCLGHIPLQNQKEIQLYAVYI